MSLETKSTILRVPRKPSREEEIITIPNHDHTQYAVMQQTLRKIKQIRKTRRTREMEDSTAETEMEVAGRNLEEIAMTKKLEVTRGNLNSPVKCVQKPLTQTY